jgi:hypothetical protein
LFEKKRQKWQRWLPERGKRRKLRKLLLGLRLKGRLRQLERLLLRPKQRGRLLGLRRQLRRLLRSRERQRRLSDFKWNE